MNAVKGPPIGKFMKKRNVMYHLEAGKIEEIVEIEIVGMGKILKGMFHKRMKKKLSRTLKEIW
jgi:hypothetical protein